MIIVLSPAKSLDYARAPTVSKHTLPDFIDDSRQLIAQLRRLTPAQIATLMKISDPLAHLNFERFASWSPTFTSENAKQAVLAFNGDVYEGLDAPSFTAADLDFAQKHVRILSGLYGVLRPLDWIQPYRLEMGTRLANARGKDLYAFWGERIAQALNRAQGHTHDGSAVLINLASQEYFKAVRKDILGMRVLTPSFEDFKDGRYKVIGFYAKRARGLMARFAITQRITEVDRLRDFELDGYRFDAQASTQNDWIFRRRIAS